jgi:hypothetical protein
VSATPTLPPPAKLNNLQTLSQAIVHQRKYKARRCTTIAFLAALLFPRILAGQRLRGPWEDATIPGPGTIRLGITTAWTYADQRLDTAGRVVPLGERLSRSALDTSAIPQLRELQSPLASLLGGASAPLSLGKLATAMEYSEYRTAVSLEVGLAPAMAATIVVPYVKNRVEVFPRPNAEGAVGSIGLNPALRFPGARSHNGQVVTELRTASARLQSELARCLGSSDPSCTALNADRQGALALLAQVAEAAAAIASIYGTLEVPGLPFAPVELGPLQMAVKQRLAGFNSRLRNFLGSAPVGEWIAASPVGAAPLALDEFQLMLGDSAVGIRAQPLADAERSHIGDLETGVKLLLFDSFRAGSTSIDPDPERGLRLAVAGVARLPTAQLDRSDDVADVGTGDRQMDLELRGFLNVGLGHGFWAALAGRYTKQLPDRIRLRVPRGKELFAPAANEVWLERDLGDQLELEVSPNYAFNEALGIGLRYTRRNKGSDRYALRGPDSTGVASYLPDLERGTAASEERVDFALTYSTLHSFREGLTRWPLEVSLLHTRAFSGRNTLRGATTMVSVRFYRAYRRGGRI